jgi:hypothetical protein
MEALNSDPRRQAVATLKGFSYQIWQSVFRWLSLGDDEALYLEGAEDVDLLGPQGAETIQIKAESNPVTLRSPGVLEAIAHFWEHQKANPDVSLTFRFLTTSERTSERPNTFENVRGLDLWDSCKYPGSDTSLLRRFLETQAILPAELKAFVKAAPDEDLRRKLFLCIEWDTGNKSRPYVEGVIERKVAAYGDRIYDLGPSESIKVIPHLLQHAWDVVCREKDRLLLRMDFMRIFQDVMTETVSKIELRRLRRSAASTRFDEFERITDANGRNLIHQSDSILEIFAPPDMQRLAKRTDLAADLHVRLNTTGILVLAGSTGMGKSTLANLIASSDNGSWRRLDLRGLSPEQIADRLRYVIQIVQSMAGQQDCLIDDLNFDQCTSVYENPLAKLIYAFKLQNGRVIITTQGTLPGRIVNLYEIPEASFVSVPPLSEEEVNQLTSSYGCPAGHKLKGWSRLIFLHTRGHPLLTHARVRSLEGKGWPSPTSEDFITTSDIEDIRHEFRRNLREQMPEETRLLLYRLSVLTSRFGRQQALLIGRHPPALRAPGECFDALIGPWIERVDATHFRLSPLLDRAASEIFSELEVKGLHGAVAKSFLAQRTLDPMDLSAMLLHGLLGEDNETLAAAAMVTFEVERKDWPAMCRVLDWFGHVCLEDGVKKLPASIPLVNFLLRRLQYKIMAELDHARAVQVARVWEQEIRAWDYTNEHPGSKHMMLFSFLLEILFDSNIPFPLGTVVDYLIELIHLPQDPKAFFPEHPVYADALEGKLNGVLTVDIYVGTAISRCRSAQAVIDFLTALDERPDDKTQEIWKILTYEDYLAMLLIDQVWLDETRASDPDWGKCLSTLERVLRLALQRTARALASAAYRAKAIVQEEYLKSTKDALQTLDEGEASLAGDTLFLKDYRAKIYYFAKQYEDALNIWRRVLAGLEREGREGHTLSYREAEVCAAKLGDWQEAAHWAKKGETAATQSWLDLPDGTRIKSQSDVTVFGYMADHAFSLWKVGDKAGALGEFAQVLKAFDHLPRPEKNIKSHMLYKRVGHVIGWLSLDIDGNNESEEPPPGCFSSQEIIEEIKDVLIQPPALLWYLLAKLEFKLRLGHDIFKRFEAECKKIDVPSIRIGYGDLKVRHALRNLELDDIVTDFLSYSAELRVYSAERQGENEYWSDTTLLMHLLFTALIRIVSKGRNSAAPFLRWRQNIVEQEHLKRQLVPWVDFIEDSLQSGRHELIRVLKDSSAPSENRLVAALILSADENLDVENRFYANLVLVITEFIRSWKEPIEDDIGSIVVDEWARIAEHERFALRAPSVNAASILTACHNDEVRGGIRKAARVLMIVKNAVRTTVSGDVLEQLRQLAQ